MSADEARFQAERKTPPRRAVSTVVIVSLYALLAIGAPFLLRYGPEPDVSAAVARVALAEAAMPRCAHAPEFGRSCAADAAASGKALFAE